MIQLLVRRIGMMILIMLVVALLLFLINEGDPRLIARSVLGPYAQAEQLDAWVIENGYDRSVFIRYFEWIGRLFAGDLGDSVIYKRPVSDIFWDRLGNTGILAGVTFVLMVLIALTLGVLAGMKRARCRIGRSRSSRSSPPRSRNMRARSSSSGSSSSGSAGCREPRR